MNTNITSNVTDRLRDLLAARRTLFCAVVVGFAPALLAVLAAGTIHVLIALALPLLPIVLLMLIAAGLLDAAVHDATHEQDVIVEFPRPLQLRG